MILPKLIETIHFNEQEEDKPTLRLYPAFVGNVTVR
jgi:hypothetical protein